MHIDIDLSGNQYTKSMHRRQSLHGRRSRSLRTMIMEAAHTGERRIFRAEAILESKRERERVATL